MPGPPQLPGWVRPASGLIIALQGVGISFFSFHVLSVPGRRSGLMRRTVVSPFAVGGERYVLSFGLLEWVRNARAAGWGVIGRGRSRQRVRLIEVPAPESAPIVREFPRQVPAGVRFFIQLGLVDAPGGPDDFAAAAGKMTLFRLDSDQS